MKNCEVCNAVEAKYTCPKCEVRTCCISCVKIHKKELECDGIRDKTKFIPKNQFTDLDLLSGNYQITKYFINLIHISLLTCNIKTIQIIDCSKKLEDLWIKCNEMIPKNTHVSIIFQWYE